MTAVSADILGYIPHLVSQSPAKAEIAVEVLTKTTSIRGRASKSRPEVSSFKPWEGFGFASPSLLLDLPSTFLVCSL